MTIILIFAGVMIAILIAIYLFRRKRKPRSVMDVLNGDPEFQVMKELFDTMSKLNEGGTVEDTIPQGIGEFGHEVTNPIPVNTVMGSIAYLGRLRTLDGKKVHYERIGSMGASNIDNPIDAYRILADGKLLATLHISPYHRKNSERSPRGFKLAYEY
jgi:hypothetical protein